MMTDKNKFNDAIVSSDQDLDFLSRWSQRKHAARQHQIQAETGDHSIPQKVDIETLPSDADMPPLESLTEESDYSGFLSPRVSEALRKQALRQLFHSTGFNICDGLDDYDEDFTKFEKLGDIITADMKHQIEMEAQRLQQLAEKESEQESSEHESFKHESFEHESFEHESFEHESIAQSNDEVTSSEMSAVMQQTKSEMT